MGVGLGLPEPRKAQADAHNNLGNTLRTTGRRAQAEPEVRRAADLYSRLAEDYPQVAAYRDCGFAVVLGSAQAVIELYDMGIGI